MIKFIKSLAFKFILPELEEYIESKKIKEPTFNISKLAPINPEDITIFDIIQRKKITKYGMSIKFVSSDGLSGSETRISCESLREFREQLQLFLGTSHKYFEEVYMRVEYIDSEFGEQSKGKFLVSSGRHKTAELVKIVQELTQWIDKHPELFL